jgi:hypothetical protein
VLLDELTRVASRPYFPKRATTWTSDAASLVARLDRGATIVPITGVSYGCRDPKDDAVIPSRTTPKPIEISEDGSAAVFDLYAGTDWEATNGAPIGRVIVRR